MHSFLDLTLIFSSGAMLIEIHCDGNEATIGILLRHGYCRAKTAVKKMDQNRALNRVQQLIKHRYAHECMHIHRWTRTHTHAHTHTYTHKDRCALRHKHVTKTKKHIQYAHEY